MGMCMYPDIDEIKPEEGLVGLLVLPTRELCGQVRDEIMKFLNLSGLRCESICGGANV